MLVLSRKVDERIHIGNDIDILVVDIRGDKCRIGIDAPGSVVIHRDNMIKNHFGEFYTPTNYDCGTEGVVGEVSLDGANWKIAYIYAAIPTRVFGDGKFFANVHGHDSRFYPFARASGRVRQSA